MQSSHIRSQPKLGQSLTTGTVTDEIKELSKVLLGAATAFAAVVFTDDLDKGEGELWPSTKTKEAFAEAFEPKNFAGGTPEYEAAFEERVAPTSPDGHAINGWGFVARYKRARDPPGPSSWMSWADAS